jgi:hypothetical protein
MTFTGSEWCFDGVEAENFQLNFFVFLFIVVSRASVSWRGVYYILLFLSVLNDVLFCMTLIMCCILFSEKFETLISDNDLNDIFLGLLEN